jgi:hypothetical protein
MSASMYCVCMHALLDSIKMRRVAIAELAVSMSHGSCIANSAELPKDINICSLKCVRESLSSCGPSSIFHTLDARPIKNEELNSAAPTSRRSLDGWDNRWRRHGRNRSFKRLHGIPGVPESVVVVLGRAVVLGYGDSDEDGLGRLDWFRDTA